jgi:hypothetical protein
MRTKLKEIMRQVKRENESISRFRLAAAINQYLEFHHHLMMNDARSTELKSGAH